MTDKIEIIKPHCGNCLYMRRPVTEEPCRTCSAQYNSKPFNEWKPREVIIRSKKSYL